jgi:uncharacterized protein YejL (UPF0352 family)
MTDKITGEDTQQHAQEPIVVDAEVVDNTKNDNMNHQALLDEIKSFGEADNLDIRPQERDYSKNPNAEPVKKKIYEQYQAPSPEAIEEGPKQNTRFFKQKEDDSFKVADDPEPQPYQTQTQAYQSYDQFAQPQGEAVVDGEAKNKLSYLATDLMFREAIPHLLASSAEIPQAFIDSIFYNAKIESVDKKTTIEQIKYYNEKIANNSKIDDAEIEEFAKNLGEVLNKHNANPEVGPEGKLIVSGIKIGMSIRESVSENKKARQLMMMQIEEALKAK